MLYKNLRNYGILSLIHKKWILQDGPMSKRLRDSRNQSFRCKTSMKRVLSHTFSFFTEKKIAE